jgi:hypothetical protein
MLYHTPTVEIQVTSANDHITRKRGRQVADEYFQ